MALPEHLARIGIVLHPRRDSAHVTAQLGAWARSHDSELVARPQDAARCPDGVVAVSEEEFAASVSAVVSLGGDGTMLGALRLVSQHPVPVLGVNLGNLGFLVEVEPSELGWALDRVERGDFEIEPHSAVVIAPGGQQAVGFNDVAVVRVPGDGVVRAVLAVGGQRIGRYTCDGLVFSTPIGSTAYSYAAGGPVVSPALDAAVIVPVAPAAGVSRPMVVSAGEPIELTLLEGSARPAIEVDGRVLRRLEAGDTVELRLRPEAGLVVRLDRDRHQRRTQVKLSLLDLPFLPEELRDLAPAERLPAGHPLPT